jgi:poly(3-hydroxybutyrate) depolymerase
MRRMRSLLALIAVLAAAAPALSQALPSLSTLRVRYNTEKVRANLQGDAKAQIDAVDKDLAEAARQGRTGEVRRLIAKGMTLLAGTPWTPQLDYQHSLVLRSERTVVDSAATYALRLEQIYSPALELTANPTARIALRKREMPGRTGAAAPAARELTSFDSVPRDLRESPLPIEVSLAGNEDGAYVIEATVLDGGTRIATTTLGIFLQKGLDDRLRALDSGAAGIAETFRADVLYPGDHIRNVNRGRVSAGTFDLAAALGEAERVLAAAKGKKDPFKGRTGDLERHHLLAGANEIMPYRVYVPTAYNAARPTPLVIALHGLGGTEDSFFDSYQQAPPKLAEQHGFLMAAPLGFRVDGFYGSGTITGGDPELRRRREFSEKDVLEVLRLMKAHYNVDESRIYLIGHSMGAIGTWYLGAKYAEIWAGLAPFSGQGSPATAERMKAIPQFVVHGDADPTVNVNGSRSMVAALKKAGAPVTYIEVPGGNHSDMVVPNLPKAFEFLAQQAKPRQ